MTDQAELTIPQRLRVWSAAGVPVTLTAQQCRELAAGIEQNDRLCQEVHHVADLAIKARNWAMAFLAFAFFFALFGWMGL